MEKKIVGKMPQEIMLRNTSFSNSFLKAVAEGDRIDLAITKVEARFTAIEIRSLDPLLVSMALFKLIYETFIYFNQECSKELATMIVDNLTDHCRRMSPVEIAKAITEGRRLQVELYGKLSAKNFIGWIGHYEGRAGEEIAEFRKNEAVAKQKELDGWDIEKLFKPFLKKKQEYSHADKVQSLQDMNISEEEQKKREHSRDWTLEEHGDYEEYMKKFKP